MFYIGTKIVVIGSNVKRKAGPRVGSIGFVAYLKIDNNFINFIEDGNFIICEALVLFTRYGFQKQTRFETKKVFLIIPSIRKINAKKTTTKILQKDVNAVKKYLDMDKLGKLHLCKLPILLVSPANNLDKTCIKGKVFSCLLNNKIRDKISCIIHGFSSKNLPNTERFQSILSKKTKNFLSSFINCKNFNSICYLINKTDDNTLDTVLHLIVKLDALNIIAERASGNTKKVLNTEVQIFDALFKPFDFRTKIPYWRRYVPLSIINYCADLRDFLCNEGNKILQKHI